MRLTLSRSSARQRGIILVLVLWIVVVLSLIAYTLLFQVSTEATMTSARRRQLRAEFLARAGLARAMVDLRNDILFDTAEEAQMFDAEGDVWARPEEGKMDAYPHPRDEASDERGSFNVRVYDEEGLFNLNRMGPHNLLIMEKIIERIGYSEEDAKIVAVAISDWKDPDTNCLLPNAPNTDEGLAYAIIQGESEGGETDPERIKPLIFRNEDFLTVDELLEVFGVTPELYFGPGTPEAIHYRAKIGDHVGERFLIEERRENRDEEPLGLRDYFTIYGNGVLNLNTAPLHVLTALAEGSGQPEGDSWAERVIKIRRGGREDDIDNDDAFKTLADLTANAEISGIGTVAGNLYQIGVTSTVFRIVSTGQVGETRVRLQAIVHRSLLNLVRDESFEFMDRAEMRRERNSGRYERRQDKKDETLIRYPTVRIMQMVID